MLKKLESFATSKPYNATLYEFKENKNFEFADYNSVIVINKHESFHYTVFFFKNKLKAIQIQYDIRPRLDFQYIKDSICQKHGNPSDSVGIFGTVWTYSWKIGKNALRMKIERSIEYGDIIILELIDKLRAADKNSLLEKELDKISKITTIH